MCGIKDQIVVKLTAVVAAKTLAQSFPPPFAFRNLPAPNAFPQLNRRTGMTKRISLLTLLVLAALCAGSAARPKPAVAVAATNISVYGAWHCGNDFCTWSTVRNMTDFDTRNHWMIDRGDGSPSVNLVVLSFVEPLKLLNKTNDSRTSQGIPIGMNSAVVNYFKSHGVRVQLSNSCRIH